MMLLADAKKLVEEMSRWLVEDTCRLRLAGAEPKVGFGGTGAVRSDSLSKLWTSEWDLAIRMMKR